MAAAAVVMLLNTAAGAVVSVDIDAIFSLVVLVQAQEHKTLLTAVGHGKRACTLRAARMLSLLPPLSSTAILSLLVLLVLLL